MKKKKRVGVLLCLGMVLCFNLSVYASGNRAFNYDFRHQVALSGSYTATKDSATFQFYTEYNGSSSDVEIQQYLYHAWGGDDYIQSTYTDCAQGERRDCSLSSDIGTRYSYEFWKAQDGAYIRGNGDLQY